MVNSLRNAHPCLDFYTTDQLVCLSSAIADCVFGNEPLSLQAGMLIKLACGDVNLLNVERMIKKLQSKIQDQTGRWIFTDDAFFLIVLIPTRASARVFWATTR